MSHKKDQLSVGDLHKQNICLTKKISYLLVIFTNKTCHQQITDLFCETYICFVCEDHQQITDLFCETYICVVCEDHQHITDLFCETYICSVLKISPTDN